MWQMKTAGFSLFGKTLFGPTPNKSPFPLHHHGGAGANLVIAVSRKFRITRNGVTEMTMTGMSFVIEDDQEVACDNRSNNDSGRLSAWTRLSGHSIV